MEFAKKRRSKNKNNKVAQKQKVGNTKGEPHLTIKPKKYKQKFAKTCLSKDKKFMLEYVPMDYNRCKKSSRFDMDHYLAVLEERRKAAVLEERRKAIEKALQEDKEKLEVDIDRANATDMEEE